MLQLGCTWAKQDVLEDAIARLGEQELRRLIRGGETNTVEVAERIRVRSPILHLRRLSSYSFTRPETRSALQAEHG